MRKLFTTLKSIVVAALAVSMVGVTSCSYDDTDLKNRVNDLEQDVDKVQEDLATLEQRVADLEKKVSDEVAALKGLIKDQVVVSNVVEENGAVTVTLSDGTEFTVYPKANPTDTNTDTYISVKADEITGVYYWAIFNEKGFVEFLKVDGERVAVFQEQEDTCEPVDLKFQVNDKGNIEFSIDGGKTWTDSGVAVGACDCEGTVVSTGACIFKNVVVRDHYVTFTLADGSEVVVFLAEFITFEAGRSHFYVKPAEVKALPFTVNEQVEDISVMNQPMGWKASVELAEDQEGVEPSKAAYVLNIEGPSQYLIGAGVAEKTGYIQLHITTVTGACKVVKVAVDLAEITLDVDKEGNITIVNTWVDSYIIEDWWGTQTLIEEFNNYVLYAIPYDYYASVDGDLSQLYDSSWGEFTCQAYGGWINNIWNYINDYNEAPNYVNGEYESWTYKCTVEELVNRLSYGHAPYEGESFVIVVIPTDPENQGVGDIDNAFVEEFKQVVATAEFVEASMTDATFNFKFKGAEGYFVTAVAKSLLDDYGSPSYEEAMAAMLYCEYVPSYGWEVMTWNSYYAPMVYMTEDFVAENYSLVELYANYAYDPYSTIDSLSPETDYFIVVVPQVSDNYPSAENLVLVPFKTAALPVIEFVEAVATYNSNDPNWYSMSFTDADANVLTFRIGNGGLKTWKAGYWDSYNYYSSGLAIDSQYYNGEYLYRLTADVAVTDNGYSVEFLFNNASGQFKGAYEGEVLGFGIPKYFVPVRAEIAHVGDGNSDYEAWLYDAEGNYVALTAYWDIPGACSVVSGTYYAADGTSYDMTVTKFQEPIRYSDDVYYFNVGATWLDFTLDLSAEKISTTIR